MLRSAAATLIQEIADMRSTLSPLELLTPTNYEAMQNQWLKSGRKFFNPTFTYDLDAIKFSFLQIERILRNIDEFRTYFYRERYNSALESILFNSIDIRCQELYYLAVFFQTILTQQGTPNDHYEEPLTKLYGTVSTNDLALAKSMTEESPVQALQKYFTKNPNIPEPSRIKLDKFFRNNLLNFQGMFRESEKNILESQEFDAQGIATYFQAVLDYMRQYAQFGLHMSTKETELPSYQIGISSKYTAVSVHAFSTNGKSIIGIPADRKVNGLKLIELVGHELNSHYRSAMSTRNLYRKIIEYCEKDLLIPLVPFISHSLNETMSEGLAKLSDIQIAGASGIPKPYQVLAIDFVEQGHNFKETMEYIFELTRQAHKTEGSALDNAWRYAYRIFRGQTDTSSHCGYAFIKDKCYLNGFASVLREISQDDNLARESFVDLLRFSTLTLDEIRLLANHENEFNHELFDNPYRDFSPLANNNHSKSRRDPVNYAASLLL